MSIHLRDELTSRDTTAVIKRTRRRLHVLRRLNEVELPIPAMAFFFLFFFLKKAPLGAFSLTASLPCLVKDDERHGLNGMSANYSNNKKIICASLLHLQDLYIKCRVHRAYGIIKFCTHPFNGMFTLVQSGERYRSMGRRTARLLKSFFPTAIRLLNQRR